MKIKYASEEYMEKARSLSQEEVERLQSRMRAKLTRREEEKKFINKVNDKSLFLLSDMIRFDNNCILDNFIEIKSINNTYKKLCLDVENYNKIY